MTERLSLARHAPVSASQHRLGIEMLLAGAGDDLLTVMRRSAEQPATRVIGIVDDSGVLTGVLPVVRLAEAVIGRVTPEALLTDIADMVDVTRFGQAIGARAVGEVMVEPAAVAPDASLDQAFRLMHERRLSGVYIVDPQGRPTGYIDLLELVLLYVDALEAPPPPSPD